MKAMMRVMAPRRIPQRVLMRMPPTLKRKRLRKRAKISRVSGARSVKVISVAVADAAAVFAQVMVSKAMKAKRAPRVKRVRAKSRAGSVLARAAAEIAAIKARKVFPMARSPLFLRPNRQRACQQAH